ncbi:MAG: alpha/beta hydrolase [Candidatus Omnitrophica bacterium]|nr:alpha/beta hydrolase [Candidatus Omnitrophota bacterium]
MILPKAKRNDVALYYEVHGRGAPLLLIAGLGSDISSWAGVINKLSAHFKVIAFDNREAGRSGISDKEYTICQMSDDAVRLLDHLKIKKTHVLGHSMGGYIAQELAIDYPERIDKLILESTAPVSSKRNNALFMDFYKALQGKKNLEAWIRGWTRWLFSTKCRANRAFIQAFVKNGSRYPYAQQASGFKGQIDAMASFDTRKRLSRIKAKTLVIEGNKDALILPKEARALAKNISGSIFRSVNGMAHCIHIENPGLFVRIVTEFLISNKNYMKSQNHDRA